MPVVAVPGVEDGPFFDFSIQVIGVCVCVHLSIM